ncbi:hypothetical protein HanRHA438_Chr08g0354641 [Helianthus annuus]|nr:hypothetical protein HanRHA438_Chr08g0354641 [Helianthus annuus]
MNLVIVLLPHTSTTISTTTLTTTPFVSPTHSPEFENVTRAPSTSQDIETNQTQPSSSCLPSIFTMNIIKRNITVESFRHPHISQHLSHISHSLVRISSAQPEKLRRRK